MIRIIITLSESRVNDEKVAVKVTLERQSHAVHPATEQESRMSIMIRDAVTEAIKKDPTADEVYEYKKDMPGEEDQCQPE